ncbi:protein GVQW3 [Trichonephila clavipes]|nr:protein GVQW3 [Trichonephila clavipes]
MCENTDQRICIKFCFKLGKTSTETYEMMKTAFGDEAMSRARVFEWFRPFKEGRQSVNSGPRSGRPSTSRNEDKITQVKAVVPSDRCLTIRELAQDCHISVGSCDEILRKDLNMLRVSGGRGSRVVEVSDRGLPCHEFEPSTTKDPPCRAAMHVKTVES